MLITYVFCDENAALVLPYYPLGCWASQLAKNTAWMTMEEVSQRKLFEYQMANQCIAGGPAKKASM
jgi:hypothetical protein